MIIARSILTTIIAVLLSTGLEAQTVSELYKQVEPSVVVIYTQEQVPVKGLEQQMATSEGVGSGVLLSEEGDILTASHVVHNAEHIVVGFPDGVKVTARISGSVIGADLAHLKLDWMPEGRTIARLGNSDNAEIGDQVFIIGAPYGIERSLSVGHVSGRHFREGVTTGLERIEFLQTDAAINRGNSGGPMFNMNGEVIGIVSYILSESGGFQGLGFVVASNVARELLIEKKAFWTGFEGIFLFGEMAAVFNLPQQGGMLVQRVVKGSPAMEMGLRGGFIMSEIRGEEVLLGGDIILAVNGIRFTDLTSVTRIRENLISLGEGSIVTLEVLRAGKTFELSSDKFLGH